MLFELKYKRTCGVELYMMITLGDTPILPYFATEVLTKHLQQASNVDICVILLASARIC